MKKDSLLSLNSGYSPELEDTFKNMIKKSLDIEGHWFIRSSKKKQHSWYFRYKDKTTGKRKDVYLCKLEEGFTKCCDITFTKLNGSYVKSKNKKPLVDIINQYILDLETRGHSLTGDISIETSKNRNTGLKDFKKYSVDTNLTLNDVDGKHSRIVFKNWFESLVRRGLKKSTIKTYLKSVRLFLEDLGKSTEYPNGYGLIDINVITTDFQNELLKTIRGKDKEEIIKEYREEYYIKVRQLFTLKVREIWENYCNNKRLDPIRDSNGKVNQPSNSLGSDVVYFISLVQIITGTRVKEVLHSFVNESSMTSHREMNNTPYSEYYSYWTYREDYEMYFLTIRFKNKIRNVPVKETIFSYHRPPDGVPHKYRKYERKQNGYEGVYETDLIDVLFELSSNEYFMFPSPNIYSSKLQPRSMNYYLTTFNNVIKEGQKTYQYGINTTHNLRSYYISFMIRNGVPLLDLCEIVGHSLRTLEQRYKREDLRQKSDVMRNTDYTSIIKQTYWNQKNEN